MKQLRTTNNRRLLQELEKRTNMKDRMGERNNKVDTMMN
jgi:hypothetical protein